MSTHGKPLLNKVLVASDSLDGMDVALQKAALIEHYSGAAVQVLEVIYDALAEEPVKLLPAADRANLIENLKAAERKALTQLAEPYRQKVADLETRVVWDRSAAQGIQKALSGVDLLIKPISRHHAVLDRLHAPLDWALTREAPCPVLISKQPWVSAHTVLAALDAGDESHHALNRAILATGVELSLILGCALDVVCAYPSLGQTVNELQVAMDYEGIKQDMREARGAHIDELIRELDADVRTIHLLEGSARDTIPDLANEMGAVLTVLGTAARRGLSQLLRGNTSEAILGALDGDLLTVREPAP